jgi:arylsulfatase A-like enzyme
MSAHSVSSWTCPAVVSLHTGLYPHRHGGGLVLGSLKNLSKESLPTLLPANVMTLPEMLAGAGYRTRAMIAVWNANLPIPGRYQRQELLELPARSLVRRALRWIREQDGPFLLWLHLGDAHEPLDVRRSFRREFGRIPRGKAYRRWSYTHRSERVDTPGFTRYRDGRVRLYDAAIRSVDAALADLWEGLGGTGAAGRTVLAVTSDHGEEFWEHREEECADFFDPRDIAGTGHGHNLFQVHLLIPMILAGSGIPPRALGADVSLVDLFATLAELGGVDAPAGDGRSLLEPLDERPILAEAIAYGYEKVAVVEGSRKLLHAPGDGYERLFELGPDRREVGTLDDPGTAARLRGYVPSEGSVVGEQVESDPEILRHLRELGYIE